MADPVLPVYTKLIADTAGIEALQRHLEDVAGNTQRAFDKKFQEVNRTIDAALSNNRLSGGGLDLGTDAIRDNVTALRARAYAAKEVSDALRQTAGSERALIAAADAAAVEARNVYQAEKQRLQILELTQVELAKTASATGAYVAAIGRGTTATRSVINSVGAQRQAYLQLGQQLQDVAIQAQLGTNPLIILTQQGSQAAFALSGLGGVVGRVATFLAGPWGAVLLGAATVVGLLVPKLFQAKDASDELAKASGGLADAQSILGQVFDTATGKILANSDALAANTAATYFNLQAKGLEFRTKALEAREAFNSGVADLKKPSALDLVSSGLAAGGSNGRYNPTGKVLSDAAANPVAKLLSETEAVFKRGNVKDNIAAQKKAFDAISKQFKNDATARDENLTLLRNLTESFAYDESAKFIEEGVQGRLNPALIKPSKPRRQRANNKAAALEEFGEDAADKIARITEQFNDTPAAIARTDQAIRQLNDILDDVKRKNPLNAAEILKAGEAAKNVIQSGYVEPFNKYLKAAREASAVDELRAQGREDEAAALADVLRLQEQMRPLTDKQKNDILATVVAERQRAAVIRDTQAIMQEYAQSIQNVRAALEQTVANALKGRLSLKNIFNAISNAYINNLSRSIIEKIFGGALRGLEDQIYGGNKIREASEGISNALGKGETAVERFADAVDRVSERLAAAANDNPIKDPGSLVNPDGTPRFPTEGEIFVNGRRSSSGAGGLLSPRDLLKETIGTLGKGLKINLSEGQKKTLGDAFGGALVYGPMASGVLKSLGVKQSKLGSQIGGAIGGAIGGPVGAAIGGAVLGTIGGALKKAKTGAATIGGTGGNLKVASITGTSSKFRDAAGGSADSAISTLEGIAEQLGGTLNASRGSVSIGIRDGKYRVDTTGSGKTKLKQGAIDFGDDASAAVKAATVDLIKDGVIEGLRASTLRLLQGGKDLEAAVAKAAKFESVFTRLKQYTDPVGAAIDAVDKEFRSLKRTFDEAGASAEEYAQLEQLYQKDRAKAVEEASSAMTSALKSLRDELTTGDNGQSLRDRLSSALATYNPLAAELQAGKQIDYDKFAEAARTVLDIQRQLDGSQSSYFARLDEITNLTAKALSDQQNVISIAAGRPSAISSPTTVEPTYTPVVDALGGLNSNITSLLGAVNQNLGTLIAAAGGGGANYNFTAQSLSLF